MVIDLHTHAYPDKISEKAREHLEASFKVRLAAEPSVSSLEASMDANGIDISVVCAVATRPEQVRPINDWVFSIRSKRLRVFASLHPDFKGWEEELERIRDHADGIKFQPEFQNFYIDDEKLFPLYEGIIRRELPVLFHCGYELSGTDLVRASPQRVAAVHRLFPGMKLIAGHYGGFRMWDEVRKHLLGTDVYFDTAVLFPHLKKEEVISLLSGHPADKILFGTDFPLFDQGENLRFLRELEIPERLKQAILGENARRLLKL